MSNQRLTHCCLLAAFAVPLLLHSQEQPLSVSTTVSTGYYNASTRGDANQSLSFVPFGARFDMDGYLLSPEFLAISAVPEVTAGPQASEAGFQGGNGIQLRTTLFRKSMSPLTFRYSNVAVKDAYFGSLTQVSGYTVNNRNKDLGVTWEFRPPHLPSTTVDWGKGSVDSKSDIAEIPDYLSHGRHLNVDSRYDLAGWDFQGFSHRQRQESNLLASLGVGATTGSLRQAVNQSQASLRRSFLRDCELYVNAGKQSTSSLLFTLPVNLTTRYAGANLRLFQRRRWKTLARANYSSNLASQLLAQATSDLGAPGSVAPPSVLTPFSYGIANGNVNVTTSLDLSHGWGMYGSAEKNVLLSPRRDGALRANFLTTSAGITYTGRFRWGSLSGDYSREYGVGSVTGEAGRIRGQTYVVSAQHGTSSGLQFDGTIHGSDQHVYNAQPFSNRSLSAEGSVARHVFGGVSGRVGGGYQWGSITNTANEFRTNGYTARASIEHRFIQVSAALNNSLSNSLPFYDQALAGLGPGSALLPPLQIIMSDYRATNFTLHTNPVRKVEFSAVWTRSRQHLQGILSNEFDMLNVYATYHFRRIELVAGLIRSNQIFAFYPTMRSRYYVRLSRTAKIL